MRQGDAKHRIHHPKLRKQLKDWQGQHHRRGNSKGDEGQKQMPVADKGQAREGIGRRYRNRNSDANIDKYIGNLIYKSQPELRIGPDCRIVCKGKLSHLGIGPRQR